MAKANNIQQLSAVRRFFSSSVVKMVLFIVLFVLCASLFMGGASKTIQENQTEYLSDAVRRAAVQCYALEGRFPDNVVYLEDNYGLIIDRNNYAVYYEPTGGNLIPQIRVIPLRH